MSTFGIEQVPFGDVTFADNPEPRCPVVLLLDVSGSMSGARIAQLNAGLKTFEQELKADSMAAKRVEVAIVTFGPVKTEAEFVSAEVFEAPALKASGDTPMGSAITRAIQMVADRKATYRIHGIAYYRPWIFMITDGAPTDSVTAAAAAVQAGEGDHQFMFFAVGVEEADLAKLSTIAVRQPLKLQGLSFQKLFEWLSASLGSVARTQVDQGAALSDPTGPNGWATTA